MLLVRSTENTNDERKAGQILPSSSGIKNM